MRKFVHPFVFQMSTQQQDLKRATDTRRAETPAVAPVVLVAKVHWPSHIKGQHRTGHGSHLSQLAAQQVVYKSVIYSSDIKFTKRLK